MAYAATPLRDRLLRHIVISAVTGCWEWQGYIRNSGYGLIGIPKSTTGTKARMISAHRASYEIFVGPVPAGMVVRHNCDNKICVNPGHLCIGTQVDNAADMRGRGRAYWGTQEACKNGHPFTPENTATRKDGGRRCIACRREASNRWYDRNVRHAQS